MRRYRWEFQTLGVLNTKNISVTEAVCFRLLSGWNWQNDPKSNWIDYFERGLSHKNEHFSETWKKLFRANNYGVQTLNCGEKTFWSIDKYISSSILNKLHFKQLNFIIVHTWLKDILKINTWLIHSFNINSTCCTITISKSQYHSHLTLFQ